MWFADRCKWYATQALVSNHIENPHFIYTHFIISLLICVWMSVNVSVFSHWFYILDDELVFPCGMHLFQLSRVKPYIQDVHVNNTTVYLTHQPTGQLKSRCWHHLNDCMSVYCVLSIFCCCCCCVSLIGFYHRMYVPLWQWSFLNGIFNVFWLWQPEKPILIASYCTQNSI